MANIQKITHSTFVNGASVIDADFLNSLMIAVNALIEAHNNPDIKVQTSEHILSIADASGNEIFRLDKSLEVKPDGDLYIGGVKK